MRLTPVRRGFVLPNGSETSEYNEIVAWADPIQRIKSYEYMDG